MVASLKRDPGSVSDDTKDWKGKWVWSTQRLERGRFGCYIGAVLVAVIIYKGTASATVLLSGGEVYEASSMSDGLQWVQRRLSSPPPEREIP